MADQALLDRLFSRSIRRGWPSLSGSRRLELRPPALQQRDDDDGSRVRRRLTVALCGDPRGGKPQHRISLFGYDEEGRRVLEELGLRCVLRTRGRPAGDSRPATPISPRSRRSSSSIQAMLDVSVRYTARLGNSQGALGKESNSCPSCSHRRFVRGW